MKVTSILLAATMAFSSTLAIAGEEERETQKLGVKPDPIPEGLANVGDGTTAGVAILGAAALIGGAAAGFGSGGGSNAPTGTTSTTSTN